MLLAMTDGRSWKRVSLAFLISISLHWLVLALGTHAGASASWRQISTATSSAPSHVMGVRLVSAVPDRQSGNESVASPIQVPAIREPGSNPNRQDAATPAEPVGHVESGWLPLEGPRYFTASELDKRPLLLSAIDLERSVVSQPEEGYLLLRLLISETGGVEKVLVVMNDLAQELEKAAVKSFGGAQFSAGILRGVPVKSQVVIEVKLHSGLPDPI